MSNVARFYTLYKDAACTELATAQEVYDAYVGGTMQTILNEGLNINLAPITVVWHDSNNGQDDASAVQAVRVQYYVGSGVLTATVGEFNIK